MQTVFSVRTPISHLNVGDRVWRVEGNRVTEVVQISWELDDTWVVWFAGFEPVSFVEDDTVLVRHEVE